jgi:hypothetical protein
VYRKLILVLSTALAVLVVIGAGGALAQPPDPPGGSITTPVTVHLFVSPEPGDSTVVDTAAPTGQINCGVGGDDCHDTYGATVSCDDNGNCTSNGPTETLTASGFPVAGYTARFLACPTTVAGSTCTSVESACGDTTCTLEMNRHTRVRVVWVDTAAPSKPTVSGPAKVGPAVRHFAGGGATDNTGVSAYRYFLDGADQGVSDTGFDVPTGSLGAGTHHLAAVALDAAGNASERSDDLAFTVDKSAAVAITSPAAGGHFRAAPTFSFTHDADTGGITCQTLDAGAVVVHSSACSSSYTTHPSADGDYSVRVLFTDDVGNTASATRAFKLDTGDPNVAITSPTSGGHVKSPFTPAFTASDGGTASASLVTECKLELDAAFGSCGARGVGDGPHTLSVRVTDEAGNDRVVSVDFVADSTGPQVSLTLGPPDDSIITSASATYGWTASDSTPPLKQTCALDGGAAAPCSSPKRFAGLSEGSHTFTLTVADALGNATAVKRQVFVNAVRPSVAITSGPAEGAVLRTGSATFGFTAAGGGAVSCSVDSETDFRPCSGPSSHTLRNLADGAHTFRVRVRDVSDDVAVASRAFAVDTSVAPAITEILKQILNPSLSTRSDAFKRFTIFHRLTLKGVPAGAKITVTCKGKRCPARRFTSRRKGGTVKLKKFTEKKLRPGTKLTIRVTRDGAIGKQFVITIRRGKAPRLRISQIG